MKAKFLQANNGDCIILNFKDSDGCQRNVIIDGGTSSTYQYKGKKGKIENGALKEALETIDNIDLLIITHIDDDHIAGILKWFENDNNAHEKVRRIWFNSGELISEIFDKQPKTNFEPIIKVIKDKDTSVNQGVKFNKIIKQHNIWEEKLICSLQVIEIFNGTKFTILSPNNNSLEKLLTKWKKEDKTLNTSKSDDYNIPLKNHIKNDEFEEDTSIPNGSSIAFIFECEGKKALFLGDSYPSIIIENLKQLNYSNNNKLEVEFVKLSHHGSKSNTNYDLLEMINTNKYIISTNGNGHKHPHKQCLARIINNNNHAELFFNYKSLSEKIFLEEDFAEFKHFKVISIDNEVVI